MKKAVAIEVFHELNKVKNAQKKRIMTDKKLCRFCRATVEHHGMFCVNCGAPLDGSEEPMHGDNEAHRPTALQTESVLDEIAKLEALHDQGVVTEKEFQEQRRKLLGTITANQSQQRFDPQTGRRL